MTSSAKYFVQRAFMPVKDRFEMDWRVVLDELPSKPVLSDLVPQYFQHGQAFRDGNRLVWDSSSILLYNAYTNRLRSMFQRWITPADKVVEFGAGTCHNLKLLGDTLPMKQKPMAVDICPATIEIAKRLGYDAGYCNLKTPPHSISGDVFFTSGSLEQVGTNFLPFLKLCKRVHPRLIMNVEPLVELLNLLNPLDVASYTYVLARGWLHGFMKTLREWERMGRVEILETGNPGVGLWFYTTQSVVWRLKESS